MLIQIIVICIVACLAYWAVQTLLPANQIRTVVLVLIVLLVCLVLLNLAGLLPGHTGRLY